MQECKNLAATDSSVIIATPVAMRKAGMAAKKSELDEALYQLIMVHLAKLEAYVPGSHKRGGGGKTELLAKYAADPLFRIWGFDSNEYVTAALAGGTITSIHRKLGDIYQDAVKMIFMTTLAQTAAHVAYSAVIVSGTKDENRSADAYLQFDRLKSPAKEGIMKWCKTELGKLAPSPKLKLIGVGMEIRHCYQTGDSKRTQADEAMARHLLVAGVLPVMPIFCTQSNPTVIRRYRSLWIVRQGMESYDMVRTFTGFDFYTFLKSNREDFRKPVIEMLRRLNA